MKKYFLLTLTLSFFSILASANTIKENFYKNNSERNLEFNIEHYEIKGNSEIIKLDLNKTLTVPTPYLAQLALCAQVQMDVAYSFHGNPNFTPEQVNEMALGAFMGCMGWLR